MRAVQLDAVEADALGGAAASAKAPMTSSTSLWVIASPVPSVPSGRMPDGPIAGASA